MDDFAEYLASNKGRNPLAALAETMKKNAELLRRCELLRSEPEPIDATVDEEIHSERVAGSPSYGCDENMEPLEDFITALREAAKNAPGPVYVKFEQEYGYEGDYDVYMKLICERPPAVEEIEARKGRNAEIRKLKADAASSAEAAERVEFERLRAKFARDSDGSA